MDEIDYWLDAALSNDTSCYLVQGQVAELDAKGARDVLQGGVVADDQRDVALQLPCRRSISQP